MSVQNQLVGTWKLLSYEERTDSGKVVYPNGPDATGYIMYSADGYMSVAIMAANRPNFSSNHPDIGTPEELAAAAAYLSYAGPFEVVGSSVFHHVDISFFPNLVGNSRERLIEFDGNKLILSSPPFVVNGEQTVSVISWERV